MPFLKVLPFVISSILVLILDYYRATFPFQQQVIAVLIILSILLGNQYTQKQLDKLNLFLKRTTQFFLLFFASSLIQIIVLSTGGFFSPVLILFHIFAIFLGFLFSFWASLSFLSLSMCILVAQIHLNPTIQKAYIDDPFFVVLYLISFLVILPLLEYVSRTYQFKSILLEKISKYLKFSEARDQQILGGLNDMVFLLDINLKIISVNNAVFKEIKLDQKSLINKDFFQEIKLRDSANQPATPASLSINHVFLDKSNRTIENFAFVSPFRSQSFGVTIQVRPVLDLKGDIFQILIVISHSFVGSQFRHQDLEDSMTKTKLMSEGFLKQIQKFGSLELTSKFLLIIKCEKDIQIAQELEDHSIDKDLSIKNLASLVLDRVQQKNQLAQSLGVNIDAKIPQQNIENSPVGEKSIINPYLLPSFISYNAIIDAEWFAILFDAVIDLAIFIHTRPEKSIYISIQSIDNIVNITVTISTTANVLENSDLVLGQYSEKISKNTRLILSSRLESFIANNIAIQLDIKLGVKKDPIAQNLTFIISINKKSENPPLFHN